MLTIQEALQLDALKNCRVIAGETGLQRVITSVNQMDAPDAVNWTKEGQFIVTTGYFIRNDVNEQKQLILDLSSRKCSGIGIKIKRFFSCIPQVMIDLANQEGMPLIEIPFEYNISEIMNELMAQILAHQAKQLERSFLIHEKFTRAVFKGGGLSEIARILTAFVNNSVSISDANWKCLCLSEHPASTIPLSEIIALEQPLDNNALQQVMEGKNKYIEKKNYVDGKEIRHYISPIIYEKRLYGFITVWETVGRIEQFDLTAVEHAATVAGLEILKTQATSEMSQRLRTDFFNDYLTGQIKSKEILIKRGAPYGINANTSYTCMILDIDNFSRIYLEEMKGNDYEAQKFKRRLSSLVNEAIKEHCGKVVTFSQSDQVVILLPKQGYAKSGSKEHIRQLVQELKDYIYNYTSGFSLSIGVGTEEEALYVYKSYSNAVEALKLGAITKQKHDSLLFFEDFYVEHLLSSINRSKLRELYNETIAPLILFDENNKMDLVKTLATYFRCNYNLTEASKEMYIHRNTFTYRLEKIREILNMDLHDYNHLLKLQLALKVKDMVFQD